MALLDESRRHRRRQPECLPSGSFPRSVAPSARDTARARDPRSVRTRSRGHARSAALARSSAAGACGIRSATSGPARAGLPHTFLPAEGREPAPDPGRARACRHHRAGHFRFTANGETVVRLEERLGYVHKGIESLMAGATLDRAAKLAGRDSGDSTVAYSFAFAQRGRSCACGQGPRRARCSCAR